MVGRPARLVVLAVLFVDSAVPRAGSAEGIAESVEPFALHEQADAIQDKRPAASLASCAVLAAAKHLPVALDAKLVAGGELPEVLHEAVVAPAAGLVLVQGVEQGVEPVASVLLAAIEAVL